ncbi:photosystem I reaction center subunit IV [Prochlorococcus sp. MIT 0801]|uniref:photosystem I reaction center subunit IV n=1 Tax=Prochlorococcus sp. MIT 0801 TaxID=1501269 RepID=UPI0004F90D25|nr:photosystem I reaction center subunit IV [Prochlorococcus sp. MIT 0801]AIQ96529.1 photosystem I subunit IV (PsaE) [Prochlorococcus sp. MIT 0801]
MSFARKDKVRILRQESYWFNQIGEIVSIDKSPSMRYPVTVKFDKCDFKAFSGVDGGANTSQFSAKELEAAVL